jgi:hypothetical protein
MGEALLVLVVAVLLAVPAGLTVLAFITARAVVTPDGPRVLAGLGLAAILFVVFSGLAVLFTGGVSLDPQCTSVYGGTRNLEGAMIEQSSGLWPPGLQCRFEFSDGEVATYRDSFDGVWVATAMTAAFGAAMGVVVVARQFSKKRDMLF